MRLLTALATLLAISCTSAPPAPATPATPPTPPPTASAAPTAESSDGLTEAQRKRACECNVDCVITYENDPAGCQAIVECTRGEPGRAPKCREGYRLYTMNKCYKECDAPGATCPPKKPCDDLRKLCMPDGTFN